MRVAAYVRVSTDEQADKGNSLGEQQERLAAYCKAMNWGAPKFFIDDGYSAKDLKRPAVKKLIREVEAQKFDIVLTTKLDRMSRNLLDMLQFVKMLSEKNCNYVSASEAFDTSTAAGRLVLQLLGTFAEFERERISERVKENMLSIARNSDKAITNPCYGYDITGEKYTINPEESMNVLLMFDLAEQGLGYRAIAKALNDTGSKTRGTAKRPAVPWSPATVKKLMHNEALRGVMIYNKRENKNGKLVLRPKEEWIIRENNHPAIIGKERYEEVKKILDSRKLTNRHADSETYLLTSLVRCGHCEALMIGNTARYVRGPKRYEYFRYTCQTYTKLSGCFYHAVHRDDLENKIIESIKQLASNSLKDIQKIKIANSSSSSEELEDLKRQLQKVNRRMQKQIEAFEEDLITAQDLKIATARTEKERSEIAAAIDRLESKKSNGGDVQNRVQRMLGDVTSIDRVVAKQAIRQLIDSIQITNGTQISITWKS
ncbi:recombinase family protein [Paenibacillus albicereus]|uniref:Recombinase family protein n=1 Tax=Paenibacillus albicereus TaxID=2726185 RepID=A0A6H2H0Z1_9BACL|nr:recombinase family protein [Paenibacillus albicereus]QJC53086.1 recombinase family protein [Paenibacillus albicereus]